jgi:hypothetical protein
VQDESWGEVSQSDRGVDCLQPAEAKSYDRGRLSDSEFVTNLRDGRDELCSCEIADVCEAIARTGKGQHSIAQVGVDVATDWRGRRGVTAREKEDYVAARTGGECHLDRAETGAYDARLHASILSINDAPEGAPAAEPSRSAESETACALGRWNQNADLPCAPIPNVAVLNTGGERHRVSPN